MKLTIHHLIALMLLWLSPSLSTAQTITYSGTNVGIGSVSPGQTLDVQGTTRAAGFNVNGYPGILGSWSSISFGTIYQASTDGFVTGYTDACSSGALAALYTDSSSTPTTIRETNALGTGFSQYGGAIPVRKNDYYEIVAEGCSGANAYFIPIGS